MADDHPEDEDGCLNAGLCLCRCPKCLITKSGRGGFRALRPGVHCGWYRSGCHARCRSKKFRERPTLPL